jgi:hypothetical protein
MLGGYSSWMRAKCRSSRPILAPRPWKEDLMLDFSQTNKSRVFVKGCDISRNLEAR